MWVSEASTTRLTSASGSGWSTWVALHKAVFAASKAASIAGVQCRAVLVTPLKVSERGLRMPAALGMKRL